MFRNHRRVLVVLLVATTTAVLVAAFSPAATRAFVNSPRAAATALFSEENASEPTTFRQAEILGLKLMQDGNHKDALQAFQKGLRLPGSRVDVKRTKSLSGPSPVGGSMGGFDSKNSLQLDEFELQAAHYNMACAHAQLGQLKESVQALETAFANGFDNYATVRGDPDLEPVQNTREFQDLMQRVDPKKGFNPFGFFGSKA